MAERVVVELDIDGSGAVRGGRVVDGALDRVGKGAADAERRVSGLGRALSAMKGWIAGIAFTALIGGLVGVGRRLSALSMEMGETESKFKTTFGSAAAAVDAFGEAWARAAGLTRNEFRGLAADVGAVVRGFGLTEAATARFSEDILRIAGDLQSFHNVPIEETFAALRSGLTGEAEPLKRFGIMMLESEVKTRALVVAQREGIAATGQQALAMARLELITEKAGIAIGDLERTQDSDSNASRRVAAEWRQGAETLARELSPTVGQAVRDVDALTQSMGGGEAAARTFAEGLNYSARSTRELVVDLIETWKAAWDLHRAVVGMGEGAEKAGGGLSVLGAALLPIHAAMTAVNLVAKTSVLLFRAGEVAVLRMAQGFSIARSYLTGGGGVADAGLTAALVDASNRLRGVADEMRGVFSEAVRTGAAMLGVGKATSGLSKADLTPALPVIAAVTGGLRAAGAGADTFKTAIQRAQAEVREFRRALDDLHATNPARLVALRSEAEELERQIDAYEALVTAVLRNEAIRVRPPTAPGKLDEPLVTSQGSGRPKGVDAILEDVVSVEAIVIESMDRVGQSLAGLAAQYGDAVSGTLGTLADAFSTFYEASGRRSKGAFGIFKAVSIAEAIVSTFVAANKALASAPPPLNYALAAAVVASGLANVARIRSMQPGGAGGSAGGGSGASVGGRAPSTTVAGFGGGGFAGPAPAPAPRVNVPPAQVNVSILAGPEGLYAVVEQGAQASTRALGSPGVRKL